MNAPRFKWYGSQRGTAAVELAILMVAMMAILYAPFLLTRSLTQVAVAQRAAGNAARMAAMYPQYQRDDLSLNMREEARAMVAAALVGAGTVPAGWDPNQVDLGCYTPPSPNCQGLTVPEQILVSLNVDVVDPFATISSLNQASSAVSISAYDYYAN